MARILWDVVNPEEEDIFLPEDDATDSDYEQDENEKYGSEVGLKKIMPTPFGMAVVDNGLNPFKNIQILMFHTDFVITPSILNKIEETPGVEILRIITPYRGALSVGKCFNSTDVRREIERKLIKKEIPNAQIRAQVEQLKQKLSKFDAWSILVFPNGYVDYCVMKDSNLEDYNKLVELYKSSLPHNNGILIQSEEK